MVAHTNCVEEHVRRGVHRIPGIGHECMQERMDSECIAVLGMHVVQTVGGCMAVSDGKIESIHIAESNEQFSIKHKYVSNALLHK